MWHGCVYETRGYSIDQSVREGDKASGRYVSVSQQPCRVRHGDHVGSAGATRHQPLFDASLQLDTHRQFNGGLASAQAEKKLNLVSGIS